MWTCAKCGKKHQDSFDSCWSCGSSKGSVDQRAAEADPTGKTSSARAIDQLIFVGLNGYALALDRDSGEIVWSNNGMYSGYVTLLLDGDRLIVSTNGYIYCLDPLTGDTLWHNPLSGYGMGAPTHLTSQRGQSSQTQIEQAAASHSASTVQGHV